MPRSTFNTTGSFILALCMAAGSASAQLVTPPEEAGPGIEYERPESGAAPVRLQADNYDNISWESLIERDDNGKIIPLDIPADWAAFYQSPLKDEDDVENFKIVLEFRTRRLQQEAIDSIDVIHEVDAKDLIGEIVGAAGGEESQMRLQSIVGLLQPLMTRDSIANEMLAAGQLNNRQTGLIVLIARQYKGELLDEVRDTFEPVPGSELSQVDVLLQQAFRQQMDELLYCYRQLLVETAPVAAESIAAMDIEDERKGTLLRKVRELDAAGSDEQKVAIMRELLEDLGTGDRQELLSAGLAAARAGN